jgi:hypothetical protein
VVALKFGEALPNGIYTIPVSGSNEPPDHAVAPPLGGVFPGLTHSPVVVCRFHIILPLSVLLSAVIFPFTYPRPGGKPLPPEPAIT